MTRSPTPAVLEALEATGAAEGDEYGRALAELLDVAGSAADGLAHRRDALVESLVVGLADRLYRSPDAHLSRHERTLLLDHLARRPAPTPAPDRVLLGAL